MQRRRVYRKRTVRKNPRTGLKHEIKQDRAIVKLQKFMSAEVRHCDVKYDNADMDIGGNYFPPLFQIVQGDADANREGAHINLKRIEWRVYTFPGPTSGILGTTSTSMGYRVMVVHDRSPNGASIAGPGLFLENFSSNAYNYRACYNSDNVPSRFRILRDIRVEPELLTNTRQAIGNTTFQGNLHLTHIRINFKKGLKVTYLANTGAYTDMGRNDVFLVIFPDNDDVRLCTVMCKVSYTP